MSSKSKRPHRGLFLMEIAPIMCMVIGILALYNVSVYKEITALREKLFVIFDFKIFQKQFVGILPVKAGFDKKALLFIPFL